MLFCVLPLRYASLRVDFKRDAFFCVIIIVAFLVFLPFTVVFFFTNFDSVYVRFDLSLFTFRLLNFVIDIPSYLGASS